MFVKNYQLYWTAGRGNILCKYIIYIFFNFGCGICGPFPMLFPKAPDSCCKIRFSDFLFQTGDIDIFVLRSVLFSRYARLKSSLSDEKTSAVKSGTHFSREAIEN